MRGEAKSLSWFWRIIWRHFKCAAQQGMRFKGWQSIWPFLFAVLEKPCNEALQALFLLVVPLWPVLLLRLHFARRITGSRPDFAQVYIKLRWIRVWTVCIGVLTLFLTAVWGMIFNINKLVL